MSATFLVTSVPVMPMPTPISADLMDGRVVDAVAGHGGNSAPAAPGGDDADLVLRLDPGIDAVAVHGLGQLLIAEGVQVRAGKGLGRGP